MAWHIDRHEMLAVPVHRLPCSRARARASAPSLGAAPGAAAVRLLRGPSRAVAPFDLRPLPWRVPGKAPAAASPLQARLPRWQVGAPQAGQVAASALVPPLLGSSKEPASSFGRGASRCGGGWAFAKNPPRRLTTRCRSRRTCTTDRWGRFRTSSRREAHSRSHSRPRPSRECCRPSARSCP